MKNRYFLIPLFAGLTVIYGCNTQSTDKLVDQRSYNLGGIGGFGELVNSGVKKLALSAALSPDEMDNLIEEAQKIAEKNHVNLYRESNLLVTDLFPADVAKTKDVLLIYQGTTKEEYLSLKQEAMEVYNLASFLHPFLYTFEFTENHYDQEIHLFCYLPDSCFFCSVNLILPNQSNLDHCLHR